MIGTAPGRALGNKAIVTRLACSCVAGASPDRCGSACKRVPGDGDWAEAVLAKRYMAARTIGECTDVHRFFGKDMV
jgi:hypothetical protein